MTSDPFPPMAVPVDVTFTRYWAGIEGGGIELSTRLPSHGVAIRWIRRQLRSSLRYLAEEEREALQKWLDAEVCTLKARAEIAKGKPFEYVSGHEGVCVRATAQRLNLR